MLTFLWTYGGGLSWNMTQRNEDFHHYVRGYEPRAKFPSMHVQERLPEVVGETIPDTTAPGAQLRLRSDIVDLNVFPYSEKTVSLSWYR